MAALRNTSRMAGTFAWESSGGTGGTILTARIFEPSHDAERLVADWSNRLLGSLAAAPSVAEVRVAVSATAASRLATTERAVRVDGVAEPQVALLVEGFGTPTALRTAFDQVAGSDPVLTGSRIDLYTLQFDLAR